MLPRIYQGAGDSYGCRCRPTVGGGCALGSDPSRSPADGRCWMEGRQLRAQRHDDGGGIRARSEVVEILRVIWLVPD